jgi:hypothetical protein
MLPKVELDNQVHAIMRAINETMTSFFAGRERPKVKPERFPVRDGDEESWTGFEGHWYLSFGINELLAAAPQRVKSEPFIMKTGEFTFSVDENERGVRVVCKPVSLVEESMGEAL